MPEKSFYPNAIGTLLVVLCALCFLLFAGCATPVIKMPKPMPDIVKEHKSFKLYASRPGMLNTRIRVTEGDFLTIMSKGNVYHEIYQESRKQFFEVGPYWKIMWQIGEKGYPWSYGFNPVSNTYTVKEKGEIFLRCMTEASIAYYGSFEVDIIIWKKEDPILIANFLEELSLTDPNNKTLKDFAQDFKTRKEIILAEKKATKEVEETKKAIIALKGKEIREEKETHKEKQVPEVSEKKLQEEAKQAIKTFQEKEVPGIKEPEKEKQIAALTEKLQKALKALQDLEELKRKVAEQKEKERELMARLQSLEEEKLKESKSPPVVVIASPKDKISVDEEYIVLSGVAEDDKGVVQIEILVNDQLANRKGQRDLQLVAKELKRIDFSERIRLREGKNEISVVARDTEGLSAKKTISVQLAKKREEVWAVVVGINKYRNVSPLKYAANDAREVYRYLVEVNKIPEDHVSLILDEEATLDKLRSVLGTHLRRKAGKDDTVIIYFAGHGATERDATSPDGDGLEKYILPHNADPKDLYASAMPMSEFSRIFQRISSERLAFISDTCYSGASGGRTIPVLGTRANLSGSFLERLSQGRGRVILTASDANQVSVEKDELNHGVFTYYLLEALRGKGDLDGDGVITVDEVYRYVSLKVPQATGQDQHPVKKGEMKGQIVLGVLR